MCEDNGDVLEVADWACLINIESNGEVKYLMMKPIKRRDLAAGPENDNALQGIRQPFIGVDAFKLKEDIHETVAIAVPIFLARQAVNYMADI
jgi:hypothetical protein